MAGTPVQALERFKGAMLREFGEGWLGDVFATHVVRVLVAGANVAVVVADEREAQAVRQLGGVVVDSEEWRAAMQRHHGNSAPA